ncbi:MAG: pyruvate synthase subunit PorB [Candidatus Methanomethylicia archaeon]
MSVSMRDLTLKEYLLPGNASCPGCPASIGLRMLGKALEGRYVLIIPACCSTIIESQYPKTSYNVPVLNIAFAASAPAAAGVKAGFEVLGRGDIQVVVWAGDGGTADIGMTSLSGVAERNDDIMYICYDNEAYMNTGIQRSSATPYSAWTTTTVGGKGEHKKNLPMIMAAHNIPYVATASIAYPLDFVAKVRRAASIKGMKYIHLHSPCPTGWRFPSDKTIEIGRLAIQTGLWPLYEVDHGKFKLSSICIPLMDKSRRKPIEDYLKIQGRFSRISSEQLEELKRYVDVLWSEIALMIEKSKQV